MRYEKGQRVWLVSFIKSNINNGQNVASCVWRMPHPDLHKINDILFKEIEIKEHHNVSDIYSTEKKYDGFIAKDENGVQFNNQYPNAEYGILNTDKDYVFNYEKGSVEIDDLDLSNGQSVLNKLEESLQEKEKCSIVMYDLSKLLTDLKGVILDKNGGNEEENEKIKNNDIFYLNLFDQIVNKFKKETGLNIETEIIEINGVQFLEYKVI